MKTFIKWPGNKLKHIRHLDHFIPETFNTYIEPFVGSGALFLHLQPPNWIIGDTNFDIINLWKVIRYNVENIINFLIHTKNIHDTIHHKKQVLAYYRNLTNTLINEKDKIQKASLFLLLKNLVYMGVLLRNQTYYFRGFDMSIYSQKELYIYSNKYFDLLRSVKSFLNNSKGTMYNKDYKYILTKAKENDFVFLDPPYIEDHKYDFKYNQNEVLNDSFIKDLLEEVSKLDSKRVKWMMTQADTPLIRKMFRKYNILQYPVFRGLSKQHKTELIIKNY